VADNIEKKIERKDAPATAVGKWTVSALFQQSGDIAAVDVRRFGMRAGDIIARGACAVRKSAPLRKISRA